MCFGVLLLCTTKRYKWMYNLSGVKFSQRCLRLLKTGQIILGYPNQQDKKNGCEAKMKNEKTVCIAGASINSWWILIAIFVIFLKFDFLLFKGIWKNNYKHHYAKYLFFLYDWWHLGRKKNTQPRFTERWNTWFESCWISSLSLTIQ